MGDFCTPRKKEVFDKIRKRLEQLRHRHSDATGRYLDASPSIYEQHKQDTLLLRQRWLESKAKKASKQSKSSRDTNTSQSDHRNLVVTKLKRKIDSSTEANASSTTNNSTTAAAAETVFNFEDKDHQSSNIKNIKTNNNIGINGANKHGTSLPSVSVQIVQQISTHCQQDTPQTIHTNVTVSSCYDTDSLKSGNTSHSVHTSIQCKQEPSEENIRSATNNISSTAAHNCTVDSASVGDIGIGIDDVDELQNILDSIEKDDDIDPSLLKDLNEFNEIYDKVQRDSESNESNNMYGPLTCGSPGLLKGVFPNLGSCGHMGSMFDSNQNMNAASVTNHTIPVPTAIPETTGPAAETLKQMAAQHQHQHSPGYPMKGIDHYTDGLRNGGFSPNYPQMYRSVPNMTSFPYNHSSNHHMSDTSQITPEMAAAMTYGGTKPLTHFPNEQGQQHSSPSSLQQLQNQVQSHFKPSMANPHQMQITQTQHMQLSHGSHSMQLSQTQQVQMQPSPQQISLSQQQTFSMGQQQMVNEQMKMQMMDKLRMEQQQQAQQGCMPPQYMGRPPPDYKMHHSARPQGPYSSTVNPSGNQNPLQTMQNMVNQTSAYGAVKTEVASASSPGQTNSGMMSSQISAMQQQQSMSVTMASNGPHMTNLPQTNQSTRSGFHSQQHMQQPPSYSAVESSTRAQSSSTYTSAIMRNQRPPNVNVGPEGLNISQPRSNTDWSRGNLMQSGSVGMRPSMSTSIPSQHGMTQSTAMSAHMMQYQLHRPPHYGANPSAGAMVSSAANMTQMQQQQQQVRHPIAGQLRGGSGAGMVPNGSQIMMQHQSIQLSQQMNMHASSPSYNIGGSNTGATSVPPAGYNMNGPSPTLHNSGVSNSQTNGVQPAGFSSQAATAPSQDEFLHFLDNPLSNEPMFDSIQNTADEFSLFEDILNGK